MNEKERLNKIGNWFDEKQIQSAINCTTGFADFIEKEGVLQMNKKDQMKWVKDKAKVCAAIHEEMMRLQKQEEMS